MCSEHSRGGMERQILSGRQVYLDIAARLRDCSFRQRLVVPHGHQHVRHGLLDSSSRTRPSLVKSGTAAAVTANCRHGPLGQTAGSPLRRNGERFSKAATGVSSRAIDRCPQMELNQNH